MIFDDDVILLSFFNRYEGEEEELKDAIVKYGKGGVMEQNRPSGINAQNDGAGGIDETDMVLLTPITHITFINFHLGFRHLLLIAL